MQYINNMEYLVSKNILVNLKEKGLITEKEFEMIDIENKKSFKVLDNQSFYLIS